MNVGVVILAAVIAGALTGALVAYAVLTVGKHAEERARRVLRGRSRGTA